MRIAIDAMGGDHAPLQAVEGALLAIEAFDDIECVLVGNTDKVRPVIEEKGPIPDRITLVHAETTIKMDEKPVEALKRKQDSSIARTVDMVKSGEADALVSAGNTGATVAATMMKLKILEGIKRAGITASMPTRGGVSMLIDVGANVNCKPEHLLQYASMASTYARIINEIDEPTVGLLSTGKEGQKGNDLVRETHKLFADAKFNFTGNVEGTRINLGECDVVVCEGFVGNVILKVSEGFGENVLYHLQEISDRVDPEGKHAEFRSELISGIATLVDYSSYGGAPLLGVNGVCIICHGRSSPRAISNAIGVAKLCVQRDVNEHIKREVLLLDKATQVS